MRKTLQPFTFESAAGGPVTLPVGVLVFAATPAVHFDPAEYGDNAHEFEPFRFVPTWLKRYYGIPYTVPPGTEMMEEITDAHEECDIFIPTSPRNHLVSASANFLGWGGGKHQCPGRFFAAVEMKMMRRLRRYRRMTVPAVPSSTLRGLYTLEEVSLNAQASR